MVRDGSRGDHSAEVIGLTDDLWIASSGGWEVICSPPRAATSLRLVLGGSCVATTGVRGSGSRTSAFKVLAISSRRTSIGAM